MYTSYTTFEHCTELEISKEKISKIFSVKEPKRPVWRTVAMEDKLCHCYPPRPHLLVSDRTAPSLLTYRAIKLQHNL